ncbi:MAG: ribosome maturation factor RimM [Solirubrobacteraceae bacterium]
MSSSVTGTQDWLRAGVIGRPHGLDGSFHVVEASNDLLRSGIELRVAGTIRRIDRLAGHARRPIVRLDGDRDRTAAEALRGQELFVARGGATELGEDEWWATDLEGCEVRDGTLAVGVVTRLLALPSCEVLEVARHGSPREPAATSRGIRGTSRPLLVPLVRDAVRSVDTEARVIDVDLRFLGEA